MRKIISQTCVESFRINLALQNVDVEKVPHRKLACRVVARRVYVDKAKEVRLRQGYGATVFALLYDASEDWRQGDSNP
jgi:hypothetical protein